MTMLIAMLAALMVWDVISTIYVLDRGGVELNPWLAKIFVEFPDWKEEILLTLKGIVLLTIMHYADHGEINEYAMYVILVVYALVGINNLKVILRMKERRDAE